MTAKKLSSPRAMKIATKDPSLRNKLSITLESEDYELIGKAAFKARMQIVPWIRETAIKAAKKE